MDVRAAVAFEAGKPLQLETVQLDGPKTGEVLVEIKATGICHTDEFTFRAPIPKACFRTILGHEGAGIVVEVGPGVTSLQAGDHVIPLYAPECRQCPSCLSRKTNLCAAIRATQGKGLMPDGSSRFRLGDQMLHHYMGCSTFANFSVLPEIAVAKIRPDAFPPDLAVRIDVDADDHIGTVEAQPLDDVEADAAETEYDAIGPGLDLGGVEHRTDAGGDPATDVADFVERHDPLRQSEGDRRRSRPYLVDMTKRGADQIGGADYTFDCTGNLTVMRQALEACHRGWGESIIVGSLAPARRSLNSNLHCRLHRREIIIITRQRRC